MQRISVFLNDVVKDVAAFFSPDLYKKVLIALGAFVFVILAFGIIQVIVARVTKKYLAEQHHFLLKKIVRYTGYVIAFMAFFKSLGIDLSALLGAAGIAGIAIGFAAQTSVSNVISGLFLISEKPFQLGDVIQVGDVSGTVYSIDFLSVKIQTFDNRFVRIPNETLIKTNVINITRFPIRRLDVWINVAYTSDLEQVRSLLLDVAAKNIYVLDNPEPLIVFEKFDSSGISILVGLWFEKSNYLALKNSIMKDIHIRFKEEGIEIPYPKMDVFLKTTP
ncbi:MAG: mechanosensitive ion channel [Treponemataceae bacterium]|nr:mechanosensitive ion channel [Treponemataceae bacterium]